MGFYFNENRLGDTYDEAEEAFFDEFFDYCDEDLVDFLVENIGMKSLVKWCLHQEGFFDAFNDAIVEAREVIARWSINEIED